MIRLIRRALNLAGLDLKRYRPDLPHQLGTLLRLYGVEAVFDVGANNGVSGRYLRNIGFRGRIVSFEPVGRYYEQLARESAADPLWDCRKMGLGDAEGELVINVSGHSGGASSFLEQTDALGELAPELRNVGSERVAVGTVDRAAEEFYPSGDRLFLKLDVQGFERKVIEGARRTLPRVVGMRVEMSIIQCYEGEPLMCEMLDFIHGLGFRLTGIEPAWSNEATQEVYQVDGVFFRPEALANGR